MRDSLCVAGRPPAAGCVLELRSDRVTSKIRSRENAARHTPFTHSRLVGLPRRRKRTTKRLDGPSETGSSEVIWKAFTEAAGRQRPTCRSESSSLLLSVLGIGVSRRSAPFVDPVPNAGRGDRHGRRLRGMPCCRQCSIPWAARDFGHAKRRNVAAHVALHTGVSEGPEMTPARSRAMIKWRSNTAGPRTRPTGRIGSPTGRGDHREGFPSRVGAKAVTATTQRRG